MSEIHKLIDETETDYKRIPQHFINHMAWIWDGIDKTDALVCMIGPGHPDYWEAWNNILGTATFTDSEERVWHLQQEGDLLAYTGDGEEFT